MSDLPKGWIVAELGDLLSTLDSGKVLQQGWSPRCDKEPRNSDDEWGVLKTTAVQEGTFLPEHNKRLPKSKEPRPHLEVKPGDLLLTNAGPRARCGVPAFVRNTPPKLILSGKMYRFRLDHGLVLPKYLEFYLRTSGAQDAIDRMKTGISDSGLNLTQTRFKALEIPVAPVAEQERIVAAIEEHFSHLDVAEVSLGSASIRLAQLRRRLLDRLSDGELVELGSILREPLRNGLSAKRSPNGTIRVLTLTAVTDGDFGAHNTKMIDRPASRSVESLWLEPGDILVQRSNTPELVGTAAMYRGPERWAIYPDLLIRVRSTERALPEYVELCLQSEPVRRYFKAAAQGIASSMPKISQSTIEGTRIPLPTVEAQRRLVAEVNTQRELLERQNSMVCGARAMGKSLRRSILAAAFCGELIPQDPSDEPASSGLLDRIRDQRATVKPSRGKRKVTTS